MKIYISHSTSFDYKNEIYIPIRNSDLNNLHNIILPHEKSEIPQITKDIIKSQDIIIAEVSYPSTGQGIELGWANIYERPIICFYKKGCKYSSSLKIISENIIEYTDVNDLLLKIKSIT